MLRHRLASAAIWLATPAITLAPFRAGPAAGLFCSRPPNGAYDRMQVAALAGAGLAALLAARRARSADGGDDPGPGAVEVFEGAALASLAVLNLVIGAAGSAAVWAAALAAWILLLAPRLRAGAPAPTSASLRPGPLSRLASAWLLLLVVGFVAFPVLQPWDGPAEPFVRWRPYTVEGERVWRGLFFAFAAGMAVCARDPLGRGRGFLVLLGLSGLLHAGEMALDNRIAAHAGGANGGPQHLYGDVLGWAVIGASALGLLAMSRGRSAAATAPWRTGRPRP